MPVRTHPTLAHGVSNLDLPGDCQPLDQRRYDLYRGTGTRHYRYTKPMLQISIAKCVPCTNRCCGDWGCRSACADSGRFRTGNLAPQLVCLQSRLEVDSNLHARPIYLDIVLLPRLPHGHRDNIMRSANSMSCWGSELGALFVFWSS